MREVCARGSLTFTRPTQLWTKIGIPYCDGLPDGLDRESRLGYCDGTISTLQFTTLSDDVVH